MNSNGISRRFLLLGGAALGLSGCSNAVGQDAPSRLDARVDATRNYLLQNYPAVAPLVQGARGVLYMPLMTEAGLGFGGAFGRGALRIQGVTVDYYSAAKGSFGIQIGAQQYAHALFFMTPDALEKFRRSSGWAVSGDVRYASPEEGASIGKESTEINDVIALVFGQQGLIAGATLSGVKYTRIIP